MHLSPLSDWVLSDAFDDDGIVSGEKTQSPGHRHRDGLLRGLAVLGVLGVLMGFAFLSSVINAAEVDTAPFADDLIHCAVNTR